MNMAEDIMVVFSTAPADKSDSIARMLIDKRVAACVNVVPVRSYYRWNGEFCDEQEHLLIAKTTKEKTGEVIASIRCIHPYDVPEIVGLPLIDGYLPYLEWVKKETRDIRSHNNDNPGQEC